MEDIDSIWNNLFSEVKSGSNKGTIRRLLNPESNCSVYAGIRSSDLSKMIFLNVNKENLPPQNRFSQTMALEIYSGIIPSDHTYAVCLILRDDKYSDLYSVLVKDIVNVIQDESSEKAAVKKFVGRINVWISFFEKYGISVLSPEKVKGLFGELWFIRQYLTANNNNKINSWVGPDGSPHDFQFGKNALEVKTTATKKPWKVKISNEIQLDDSGLENLFLYHLVLRENEGDGVTIPVLVNEIMDSIKDNHEDQTHFTNMLLKSGYIESQSENYLQKGFIIYQENFYRVCEGFPRFTSKSLPDGVGDINYTVSLASAGRYLTNKEDVLDILRQ